jgi:predicted phosphodiesterase
MVSETEVVCLYGDDAAVSMTIALIADIHGNLTALEAVLDALRVEPTGEIVCLGDVAATGSQPREVVRRLRDLGCPMVMSNADAELHDCRV